MTSGLLAACCLYYLVTVLVLIAKQLGMKLRSLKLVRTICFFIAPFSWLGQLREHLVRHFRVFQRNSAPAMMIYSFVILFGLLGLQLKSRWLHLSFSRIFLNLQSSATPFFLSRHIHPFLSVFDLFAFST